MIRPGSTDQVVTGIEGSYHLLSGELACSIHRLRIRLIELMIGTCARSIKYVVGRDMEEGNAVCRRHDRQVARSESVPAVCGLRIAFGSIDIIERGSIQY